MTTAHFTEMKLKHFNMFFINVIFVQAFWKAIFKICLVPLKTSNIKLTDLIIGVGPEIPPNQISILVY